MLNQLMSKSGQLTEAIAALREEKSEVFQRWIRDGVQNVIQLKDSDDSPINNLPDSLLRNPNLVEQDAILSYLLEYTLKIQFNWEAIEDAERLLKVGSEARTTVRHHFGSGSTAEHVLEAHRPTFIQNRSEIESIEIHHLCTEREIIDCLSSRLLQKPEVVVARTIKLQNTNRPMRFENPPPDVDWGERINNFQRSAQLLTLIGNVTDLSFNEGVQTAIDYYEGIRVDNLADVTHV